MDIKQFKKVFDKDLTIYVRKKIIQSQKIASRPRTQQILAYVEDSIFAGGKRIRPYLIYLFYKLYWWQEDKEVIRFGQSTELIHTMALMHDDIIDRGSMRHNKPCMHIFASEIIGGANKEHLGVSQALLVGDLLFARAYEVMYNNYTFPLSHTHRAQKHMQEMIEEVISGQMIDVDSMTGDHVDVEKLEAKNHFKSWQYTFTRPMTTWAILAWVDKKTLRCIEKIWMLLWKAYQMRDDILDVTFTEWDDPTNYDTKTTFSDIQDGQQTYLTNYIYEKGTYAHRLAISKAMWKRLSASQIVELRSVFIESWAIAYWKSLLDAYLKEASGLIKKLWVVDGRYKIHLEKVVEILWTI